MLTVLTKTVEPKRTTVKNLAQKSLVHYILKMHGDKHIKVSSPHLVPLKRFTSFLIKAETKKAFGCV